MEKCDILTFILMTHSSLSNNPVDEECTMGNIQDCLRYLINKCFNFAATFLVYKTVTFNIN